MKTLFLLAVIGLASCDGAGTATERARVGKDEGVTKIENGPYITTVEHDRHKFVVSWRNTRADGGVAIIHHPACECRQGPQKR